MSGASIFFGPYLYLAILAGLAVFVVVVTVVSMLYQRSTGRMPKLLRNLLIVVVLGVFWWSTMVALEFGTFFIWLFTSLVILPIAVVSVHLTRETGLPPHDVLTTALMAWAVAYFLGAGVTFGSMTGFHSLLDFHYTSIVDHLAVGAGGLSIVLSMVPLSNRLARELYSVTTADQSSPDASASSRAG